MWVHGLHVEGRTRVGVVVIADPGYKKKTLFNSKWGTSHSDWGNCIVRPTRAHSGKIKTNVVMKKN